MVDARDPLTYRSEDLERYALALHPTKRSLLLLNKADLLPEALRCAWADHLDALGCDYVFWSAKAGMDEHSTGAARAGAGRPRAGRCRPCMGAAAGGAACLAMPWPGQLLRPLGLCLLALASGCCSLAGLLLLRSIPCSAGESTAGGRTAAALQRLPASLCRPSSKPLRCRR